MQGNVYFFNPEPPASGVQNMRRDWDLLRQAEAAAGTLTWVRIYSWDRPTVSLGKHQQSETAVATEVCRRHGIPVVHRPTGGRAVLHSDEVTYAIVSNAPLFFARGGLSSTYELISRCLVEGLKRLGLQAALAAGSGGSRLTRAFSPPCFATHARFELTWEGRKIAGSAQRRLKRAFLQHGSLPLTLDYDLMSEIFELSASDLRSRICSLAEALDRRPSFEEARDALSAGFRAVLQDPSHKAARRFVLKSAP